MYPLRCEKQRWYKLSQPRTFKPMLGAEMIEMEPTRKYSNMKTINRFFSSFKVQMQGYKPANLACTIMWKIEQQQLMLRLYKGVQIYEQSILPLHERKLLMQYHALAELQLIKWKGKVSRNAQYYFTRFPFRSPTDTHHRCGVRWFEVETVMRHRRCDSHERGSPAMALKPWHMLIRLD